MKKHLSEKAPRTYESSDEAPVDCTNDAVMVKEGLRRPKLLIDFKTFKADRDSVKGAMLEWREFMKRKFKGFKAKQRKTYDITKGAILS